MARQETAYSREEFEVMATFNPYKKDDMQGEIMLQWASNPSFQPKNIRRLRNIIPLRRTTTKRNVLQAVFDTIAPYFLSKEDLQTVEVAGPE